MSGLWPRNKPLTQPSHYGRIGAQPEHAKPCPITAAAAAVSAVRASHAERTTKTIKNGARAVVR